MRTYRTLRLSLFLIALVTTMVPLLHASTATAAIIETPGAVNPEFMGMVIRDPYYDYNSLPGVSGPNTVAQDEMGRQLANLGVRWVRLDLIADNGHVDFNKYDYFIGTVAPRHGLKVLGLLNTSLATDNPYSLNTGKVSDDPVFGGATNDYMRHWLAEALRVAEHYNGSNPVAGRIHAFEILNEVNRLGDGTNLPDGVAYAGMDPALVARIHAKFYRLCKNTDGSQPTTRCPADTSILLGGIHTRGTSKKRAAKDTETYTFTDEEYIMRMYQTAFSDFRKSQTNLELWRGAWPVDGIAIHPYPEEIEPRNTAVGLQNDIDFKILPRLNQIRNKLASDPSNVPNANQPFWVTEIGFNVGFYKVRGAAAEASQATFMRQVYTALAARGDVANVFWFKYEDFPPGDVIYDNKGKAVGDPQKWGVVHIPFTEGSQVNSAACAGGACYDPSGVPAEKRMAYQVYRELAGFPAEHIFIPNMVR